MNILHTVESYYPARNGMAEVVRQISENLVKKGHTVTVATSVHPDRDTCEINGVHIEEFDDMGVYRDFLLENDYDYDIITNFAAQQWATDTILPCLPCIHTKKVFVPTGFSGLNLPQYKEYYEQMPGWMRQYDACVFPSDTYQDIAFAREHGIKNPHVIPNGASVEEFMAEYPGNIREELGIPEDHFLILLVGSHTGQKGHKKAIEIFRRANLPKSSLVIVGEPSNPFCFYSCKIDEWMTPGLKVLQLPRDQTVALYHAADLFLFPSNIECSPIVLFECMASRTPFLVTDVGNAKEIIKWSGGGALLPTTKDERGFSHADIPGSVAALIGIYWDMTRQMFMQANGIKAWYDRFTWEKIAGQYESLYQSLLAGET